MANTVKDLRFSIYINNSSARNSLIEMEKATDSLKTQMGALVDAGKKDTDEYRKLKAAFDDNQKSMTAMKKDAGLLSLSMKDLKQQAGYLRSSLNNAVPGTEKYKAIEKELIVVERRMNDLKEASIDARKGTESFSSKMSAMPGVVGTVGQSLQGLGMMFKTVFANPAMIALTAIVGLGVGLWSLAKYSMEFGKAVSNLSALTGATGKDLDFLKDKAKELAKQYGQSAVEIVDAMKLVGSAKPELLSNVQALSEVTASVLTLSKATGMELSESTKAVTTIMNQFGLSALESDRTINVLAAGSKFGAVEVDYLGESIAKVGTVAKSAGLSLEQTTAVMELFGEKGVKAETAGNGFKRVLVELQSDTKNYTNGVFDLNKAIDNNQKISGDNIALQKKFGTEFFGLAQILFQNKERFAELTTQVTGTTTAEEQMRIATDNLSGDMDRMGSSWNAFILSLEDGQGPISNTFRALIQWATDAVDVLGKLTKSKEQNEASLVAESANNRIKTLKEEVALAKDKEAVINASITAEQHIYQRNNEKIKKLKSELVENDKKNFFMHSTQLDAENKKEIASLQKHVNRSIAYVNAAAGLRTALRQEASKTTVPGGDKSGGDTETEKDRKKRESAEKKSEQDRLKKKLDALENEFIEAQNKRKKLHETDKATEESYNKDLLQLQIDYLEKKKNLYKVGSKDYNEIEGQLQDIRLKQTKDGNAALLKVAQDNFKANTKSTDSFEKLEKIKLLKSLEDKTSTKKQYDDSLSALDVTANERRVADANAYAKEIETVTFESEDAKLAAVETANQAIVAAEEKLALSKKAIDDKKLKEEEDFQEKRKSFRDKFGLDDISSIKKQYDKELAELKKGLNDQYLTEKEFRAKKLQLGAKTGAKYAQQAVEYSGMVADAVSAYQQMETASLETEKQKQLSAAGNNAEARAKIEAEFAQKELDLKKKQSKAAMAIQIAQAVAAGALAIANIWAHHAANPILAGILTAISAATSIIQIGTIVKQNAAIQATTLDSSTTGGDASQPTTGARVVTPQAAEGRYDVLGAQDGRTYRNVRYAGVARTGMVHTPTLYGEAGTELVISAPDLRRLNMKAPGFNNFVLNNRVNQRADGNYSPLQNGGGSANAVSDNSAYIASVVDRNSALIQYLIDNGLDAFIMLDQFEKKVALRDKSLKKGSIS